MTGGAAPLQGVLVDILSYGRITKKSADLQPVGLLNVRRLPFTDSAGKVKDRKVFAEPEPDMTG
ncbi:MAG: hypothetical protein ACREIM_08910 [Nitrospiraceae bacterium]